MASGRRMEQFRWADRSMQQCPQHHRSGKPAPRNRPLPTRPSTRADFPQPSPRKRPGQKGTGSSPLTNGRTLATTKSVDDAVLYLLCSGREPVDPAGRITGVNRWRSPTAVCLRASVAMTGTRGQGPQGLDDEQISVVLPEHPRVLTPRAAAALLRLLRNVDRGRGREARQEDRSTSVCVHDDDEGG